MVLTGMGTNSAESAGYLETAAVSITAVFDEAKAELVGDDGADEIVDLSRHDLRDNLHASLLSLQQ